MHEEFPFDAREFLIRMIELSSEPLDLDLIIRIVRRVHGRSTYWMESYRDRRRTHERTIKHALLLDSYSRRWDNNASTTTADWKALPSFVAVHAFTVLAAPASASRCSFSLPLFPSFSYSHYSGIRDLQIATLRVQSHWTIEPSFIWFPRYDSTWSQRSCYKSRFHDTTGLFTVRWISIIDYCKSRDS